MKVTSEAEVDQTSASASKAGPSKESVELSNPNNHPNPQTPYHSDSQQPMETDFVVPLYHHGSVYCSNMAPNMYPVSSVKECNRKGGKCKISQVLQ